MVRGVCGWVGALVGGLGGVALILFFGGIACLGVVAPGVIVFTFFRYTVRDPIFTDFARNIRSIG